MCWLQTSDLLHLASPARDVTLQNVRFVFKSGLKLMRKHAIFGERLLVKSDFCAFI